MDGICLYCEHCGRLLVNVDPKTRTGSCEQGHFNIIPREKFNENEKVTSELDFSVKCFLENRFDDAKQHAENVLALSIDNLPAFYIRAYYESFVAANRKSERMKEFFRELNSIKSDPSEFSSLKKLFLFTAPKLVDYENDILRWIIATEASKENGQKFADTFSPITISKWSNMDFLTSNLAETYEKLATLCSIPKTCYALLQSLMNNPDSPLKNNSFFLKTKTTRFLNQYLLPIGKIVSAIDSKELREKFVSAYKNVYNKFMEKYLN